MAGKFIWARFWAKQLDIFLFAFIWAWISFSVYPGSWDDGPRGTMFWFGVLIYPFWEAMLVTTAGTSFGRIPFGLSVRDAKTQARPSLRQALTRTWRCWIWGCGLAIPLLSWVLMLASKGYLQGERLASWDEIAGTEVVGGS